MQDFSSGLIYSLVWVILLKWYFSRIGTFWLRNQDCEFSLCFMQQTVAERVCVNSPSLTLHFLWFDIFECAHHDINVETIYCQVRSGDHQSEWNWSAGHHSCLNLHLCQTRRCLILHRVCYNSDLLVVREQRSGSHQSNQNPSSGDHDQPYKIILRTAGQQWLKMWTKKFCCQCMNVCVWMGKCGKCCKTLWVVSRLEMCHRNASPFTIYILESLCR